MNRINLNQINGNIGEGSGVIGEIKTSGLISLFGGTPYIINVNDTVTLTVTVSGNPGTLRLTILNNGITDVNADIYITFNDLIVNLTNTQLRIGSGYIPINLGSFVANNQTCEGYIRIGETFFMFNIFMTLNGVRSNIIHMKVS